MSDEISTNECQCCSNLIPNNQVTVCEKQHVVCHGCYDKLGRSDCLFCIPHQTVTPGQTSLRRGVRIHIDTISSDQIQVNINIADNPSTDNSNMSTRIRKTVQDSLTCLLYFTLTMAKFVSAFLLLVYLGKCYIWLYFTSNPDRDRSWFGWDKFNHILGEALLGLFGTCILVGCCIKDNN
jgi:hypothetical protein